MNLRAVHSIRHDDIQVDPGQIFTCKNQDAADRLLEIGAAIPVESQSEPVNGKTKARRAADKGPATSGDPQDDE